METTVCPDHLPPSLAWIYAEPDPNLVVQQIKENARRALAATTSPPGYGVVQEPERH